MISIDQLIFSRTSALSKNNWKSQALQQWINKNHVISGLKKCACLCFCEIIKRLKHLFSYHVGLFMAGQRCLAATVSASDYLLVPRDGVATAVVEPLHISDQLLIKLTCSVLVTLLLGRTLFNDHDVIILQTLYCWLLRAINTLLAIIKKIVPMIFVQCVLVLLCHPFYMPCTLPYNMPCNTSLWFPALHRVRLSHWFRRKRRESGRSMVALYLGFVHIPANQTTLCI